MDGLIEKLHRQYEKSTTADFISLREELARQLVELFTISSEIAGLETKLGESRSALVHAAGGPGVQENPCMASVGR
jgi:hypothetical protein